MLLINVRLFFIYYFLKLMSDLLCYLRYLYMELYKYSDDGRNVYEVFTRQIYKGKQLD